MITAKDAQDIFQHVWHEIDKLREAGQKEYAHNASNALANFERVSEATGVSREQVLLVYLSKHMDGIHSYCKGHVSQRESVEGRINDAIVYLILLRCMVQDNKTQTNPLANIRPGTPGYDFMNHQKAVYEKADKPVNY
jgi:hypothetical protein